MEIFYFTGTGNSLTAARDIAQKTDGKLISIPSVMEKQSIPIDSDALGIVFPVYHGGLPLIVHRFIRKIENLADKYIFGVCTYGDHPGLAIEYLKKLVCSQGGQLAAGFTVRMPYNYITPPVGFKNFLSSFTLREIPIDKQQALFANEKEKMTEIAAFVSQRKCGAFETDMHLTSHLADALNLKETLGKSFWLKIAGVDKKTSLSFLESRQLMDQGFHTDEKCNGCGICTKICPVDNIDMAGGLPHWQHHCEQCFACLQWCPQQALQFGSKTGGDKRYHHPGVKLADMLNKPV